MKRVVVVNDAVIHDMLKILVNIQKRYGGELKRHKELFPQVYEDFMRHHLIMNELSSTGLCMMLDMLHILLPRLCATELNVPIDKNIDLGLEEEDIDECEEQISARIFDRYIFPYGWPLFYWLCYDKGLEYILIAINDRKNEIVYQSLLQIPSERFLLWEKSLVCNSIALGLRTEKYWREFMESTRNRHRSLFPLDLYEDASLILDSKELVFKLCDAVATDDLEKTSEKKPKKRGRKNPLMYCHTISEIINAAEDVNFFTRWLTQHTSAADLADITIFFEESNKFKFGNIDGMLPSYYMILESSDIPLDSRSQNALSYHYRHLRDLRGLSQLNSEDLNTLVAHFTGRKKVDTIYFKEKRKEINRVIEDYQRYMKNSQL
ncbi:MAG: DUF6043 family protein [Prevotella sp.]|jgi:hypothetical protein